MLRHKNIDRICCAVLAAVILLTAGLMGAEGAGVISGNRALGYEDRLFDQSRVHVIDIVMEDWEGFLDTCASEEYSPCTVIIDGESFSNAGIRGKGNTSLSSVAQYGNDRYSFKIEFDQYQTGMTYHGLDKLSLNNLIQDKTLMKDYVAYTLMNKMGVSAPLCSFVQIRVNGEDWGFYLAVEGVEDSFLKRNYGSDYGELYKPDSMSFGGGRGNGRDFDMNDFAEKFSADTASEDASDENAAAEENAGGFDPFGMGGMQMPEGFDFSQMSDMFGGFDPSQMGGMDMPTGFDPSQMGSMPGDFDPSRMGGMQPSAETETGDGEKSEGEGASEERTRSKGGFGGGFGGFSMGSSDVKLQYTDDDPSSYSNIFNNAKTDITDIDRARLITSLKTLTEGENIESVVDTDAVIRYFAVHNFLCNDDSYTGQMIHNYYLYEEDGVLSMIPWDYNLAFGGFSMGGFGGGSGATNTVNTPIDTLVSSGDIESRPMAAWISANEDYMAEYHEIYGQFMAEVFESGWFEEEMNRVIGMIAPFVEGDENGFFTYDEFLKGSAGLMEFCSLRAQSVAGQLDGTIPSTSEGQRTDTAALIDASHINLSDLGEFGMGGGGGFNPSDMFGGRNRDASGTPEAQPSEETAGETAGSDPAPMNESIPDGSDSSAMPNGMSGSFDPSQTGGMSGGFDPSQTGGMSGGFDPSQTGGMSGDFDPSQMGGMSGGFDPSQMGNMQPPTGFDPSAMFGGMPGTETVSSEEPEITAEPEKETPAETAPDKQEAPAGEKASSSGETEGSRQNRDSMSMSFPGMNVQTQTSRNEQTALFIGSIAVLIIGILFAKLFRGKM